MIGRQEFLPDPTTLRRVFSCLGINADADEFLRDNEYGEEFFARLGATEVRSLDYSSYEGADILHDMNRPLPNDLRETFSVVHDGGTIEHVFNISQALKNCMEMVEVGGHFTQVNVANNLMGHGFWQFSPELLFRAFSASNGYQIETVLLHELVPAGRWYVVADPDELRARVQLCNSAPTYILTIAKRVARAQIFATPPQQSDYVAVWNDGPKAWAVSGSRAGSQPPRGRGAPPVLALKRLVPTPIKRSMRQAGSRLTRQPHSNGFDQACYRPISEDSLLRGNFRWA
jgi:hypothetical protein